jgi:hypothetical protein
MEKESIVEICLLFSLIVEFRISEEVNFLIGWLKIVKAKVIGAEKKL